MKKYLVVEKRRWEKFAKKLFLLLIIYCGIFSASNAQITVQIRQSNPYNFTSKDVWNIDVINPTQIAIKVYAQASISLNNKKVVELQSLPTEIKPGMNNFTPVVLGTKTINYLDNNLLEIENISGSLPAGNYTVCILFKCLTSDCSGAGSDAVSSELATCENIQAEQPTPLLLSFPDDGAKIKEKRPGFGWIPPMPLGTNPKISYKYTLVKLNKNQNKMDGILRNLPLIQKNGLPTVAFNFPSDIADLEEGMHYAWQVEAWFGEQKVGVSEVWEFEVEKREKEVVGRYNVLLESENAIKNIDNNVIGSNDTVNLIYSQKYAFKKKDEWKIKLINTNGSNTSMKDIIINPKFHGLGQLFFIPNEIGGMELNKLYEIVLETETGEKIKAYVTFN